MSFPGAAEESYAMIVQPTNVGRRKNEPYDPVRDT